MSLRIQVSNLPNSFSRKPSRKEHTVRRKLPALTSVEHSPKKLSPSVPIFNSTRMTTRRCGPRKARLASVTLHLNVYLWQRIYTVTHNILWFFQILILSFGGTLSASYNEAKKLINAQEKIILNRRRVTVLGEASYNTRKFRHLDPEFREALCELPLNFSQSAYLFFLQEWGTHVITGAKLGVQESERGVFSKKTIINSLQRNQSGVITNKAGFLSFVSSSLTGKISDELLSELRSDKASQSRWTSAVGSPLSPAPISLTLRGLETFIRPLYVIGTLPHFRQVITDSFKDISF